jgi:hypothetical protein
MDNTEILLSDGDLLVDLSTTQESEEDYDILIQGSDRKYPAIVIRRKHRGKGATIRTISKNGQHKDLYAEYESVVEAYKTRRDNRKKNTVVGDIQDNSKATRADWVDKTIQSVVKGRDNS